MKATSVNINEAKELTIDIIKAGLTPMISSSPGMGKSDYLKAIAEEFNLKLIDVRLSQADSVDLNGFPTIDIKAGVSRYVPFDTFPTEDTPIPDGYKGWMILLDEITSAPNLVQAASYRLILDHEVGQKKLHPKVITVAAGNLATDKAIVNRMSTAMQSRMIHLQIKTDLITWVSWAIRNDIDYRIIAFLRFKPELLHKFDPNHNDVTFPCPRTWAFLSKIISKWAHIGNSKLPLLTGTVSEGAGIEFKAFTDIFESLPTTNQLLSNPESVHIPDDPSIKYAFTALVANIATADNLDDLVKFVSRLPLEFQVITMQAISQKSGELIAHPLIQDWMIDNANELI